MASIDLVICGITTRINIINNYKLYTDTQKRYHNFLSPVNKCRPDIKLSLKIINNTRGIDNGLPSVKLTDGTVRIKGNGFACNISRKNKIWTGTGIIEENIYQLDTLLRLLHSHFMLKDGGFLIHACGINHRNKGYLFAGRSGSGKTTLAKKSPFLNVLSDELVGLRLTGSKPVLMGTPFWGEFQKGGQPISCALNGIYFLKKAPFAKLIPLPSSLALKKLFKLILFFDEGPDSIINTQRLLNSAGGYLLNKRAYQINLAKNTSYKTILRMVSHNDN
jgi:hypothetical protein